MAFHMTPLGNDVVVMISYHQYSNSLIPSILLMARKKASFKHIPTAQASGDSSNLMDSLGSVGIVWVIFS